MLPRLVIYPVALATYRSLATISSLLPAFLPFPAYPGNHSINNPTRPAGQILHVFIHQLPGAFLQAAFVMTAQFDSVHIVTQLVRNTKKTQNSS